MKNKLPSKNLAKSSYQKLLADITGIYDKAVKDVVKSFDSIFKRANWKIGERIVEIEQNGESRATKGDHLLERLSKDLTVMNRRGFSVTNLRNMRLVYQSFSFHQISDEMTWSHYVVLSSIRDKEEREAYAKKAAARGWKVEELQNILIKDQVKTLSYDGSIKSLPHKSKKTEISLSVQRGILNTYKVMDLSKVNLFFVEDPSRVWIDFGFRNYQRVRPLQPILAKPDDILLCQDTAKGVTLQEINPKDFEKGSLLYTYAARMEKPFDADTLTVQVRLSDDFWTRKKLRLRKINAPELSTTKGRSARNFVIKTLKNCPWIVVKTYSTDIFDRYLADVFYLPDCQDPARIALEGKLLNQELIDHGFADVWRTLDPVELALLK